MSLLTGVYTAFHDRPQVPDPVFFGIQLPPTGDRVRSAADRLPNDPGYADSLRR